MLSVQESYEGVGKKNTGLIAEFSELQLLCGRVQLHQLFLISFKEGLIGWELGKLAFN